MAHDVMAGELLENARRLRFLDDATRVAREELDELADLVRTLPDSSRLPRETSIQFREIVARMDRIDEERDAILNRLPTVPVRV